MRQNDENGINSIITFYYLHCKGNTVAGCHSGCQFAQDITVHITKVRFIHHIVVHEVKCSIIL